MQKQTLLKFKLVLKTCTCENLLKINNFVNFIINIFFYEF